ncbi:MAG: ribosome silencing factor [Actinobacteria bacterium]|nr:ribosome silencing factor [Actinomycetota bacterium]
MLAARAAASKKAQDILILEVADLINITDYFVICSGSNERQVATITDEVAKRLKDAGYRAHRIEGERENRWVLIDFIDIVVHVFNTEDRQFYELERLWKDAPVIAFEPEEEQEELAAPGA